MTRRSGGPRGSAIGFAALAVCAALALSGCGRKGALEPPPAAAAVPVDPPAQSSLGENATQPWLDGDTPPPRRQPPPVAARPAAKTFPLDPILN